MLRIRDRSTWGPRGTRGDLDGPKRELFVHHSVSGGAAIDTLDEQIAAMRRIEGEHLGRGFDGIGYSFVVFQPFGTLRTARIFEGRGWDHVPAAQLHRNSGTIAVCVVGDFRTQKVRMATRVALWRVARVARKRKGVTRIGGHRDVTSTECPGDRLYAQLGTIAKRAKLARV